MTAALAAQLHAYESRAADAARLRYAFCLDCARRVRHLLESDAVLRCLDTLAHFVDGRCDTSTLDEAAVAAALANGHPGSRSIDGVGHAAVSASYAVANALAGRAIHAAEYAAYAMVYASGGYGAVVDRESFEPEREWQLQRLHELAARLTLEADAA